MFECGLSSSRVSGLRVLQYSCWQAVKAMLQAVLHTLQVRSAENECRPVCHDHGYDTMPVSMVTAVTVRESRTVFIT
jgi:hypothetical protein